MSPGEEIRFKPPSEGGCKNLSLAEDSSELVVGLSGIYRISYMVNASGGRGTAISLLLNGAEAAGSRLRLEAEAGQIQGLVTLSLKRGDTLAVRVSDAPLRTAEGTNAVLDLLRLA